MPMAGNGLPRSGDALRAGCAGAEMSDQMPRPPARPVLLSLGSNAGDSREYLRRALHALGAFVRLGAVSPVYRTEPVGAPAQRDFLNLVCRGTTLLDVRTLLQHLQSIEVAGGRARPFPNAPRTIDIDILDFDGEVVNSTELALPHPRLHLRRFVLIPLSEIAPGWRHPVLGSTAADLLATAPPARVEQMAGATSLLPGGGG